MIHSFFSNKNAHLLGGSGVSKDFCDDYENTCLVSENLPSIILKELIN
jgi:hypothetical protein